MGQDASRRVRAGLVSRAGFLSILLLGVHPELGIGPILIGAGARVLLDIRAGKEVTIAGLEGLGRSRLRLRC